MQLIDALRILRRFWAAILSLVLVGVAVGAAAGLLEKPTYSSTAKAYVSTVSLGSIADLSQGGTYAQQIVTSYASVVSTPFILEPVNQRLRLNVSSTTLSRQISASVEPNTVLLDVTATGSDARTPAKLANAVVEQLSASVAALTPQSNSAATPVEVTMLQPAVSSTTPVSPRRGLYLAIGAALGLIAGFIASFAGNAIDTKVRHRSDLEVALSTPILGVIPFDSKISQHPLIDPSATNAHVEAYKSFRTNLQFLRLGIGSEQITITSAVPSEGKSVTAANLAVAMSTLEGPVLLVDADLRRPRIAQYFGLDGTVGLTDVLIGKVDLEDAVQSWKDGDLHILPSGLVPPNPNELLQSAAMLELHEKLRGTYNTVIFDAPPLLPVSDGAVLARNTNGAIMIAAAGKARKGQVLSAADSLNRVGARLLGSVLTMAKRQGSVSYSYGDYSYSSRSQAD